VRELSNIVERAAVLARTPTIRTEDLPAHVLSGAPVVGAPVGATGPLPFGTAGGTPSAAAGANTGAGEDGPLSLEASMKEPERQIILQALKSTNWNKLKAAEVLKINRTTLYKKMKRLNIDPSRDARAA
jgi:DNA-binding NtrC family response regulator